MFLLYVRQTPLIFLLYVRQTPLIFFLYVRQTPLVFLLYVRQAPLIFLISVRQTPLIFLLYVRKTSLMSLLYMRQTPLIFLLYVRQTWKTITSSNLSAKSYLPFIWNVSVIHIYDLPVYVKEELIFGGDLSLENSANSYSCFQLAFLHLVSYFFVLF